MLPRRSHAKSRDGCQLCKQRHIKCDESGPPCTNCASRGAICTYGSSSAIRNQTQLLTAKTGNPSGKPCLDISKPSRKLLELELMHRWSTSTYRSFSTDVQYLYVLQVELPREALSYEFMLNGIYAIAALDLAVATTAGTSVGVVRLSKSSVYLGAAMEYYGRASIGFRAEICQISRENYHAVWMFSFLAAVFHLALPNHGCDTSGHGQLLLNRMVTLFEMYSGVAWITKVSFDWLQERLAPARVMLSVEPASPDLLEMDTKAALSRLRYLNEEISNSYQNQFKIAIKWLEKCFAEEAKALIVGFCMAWPAVLGRDFAAAIRSSEHMALLLLMHWAILIHRLPREAWWVKSIGKDLVEELSKTLSRSNHASMPQWKASISWVRLQVDLPSSS